MDETPEIVDISRWQMEVDLQHLHELGVKLVIMRVGVGYSTGDMFYRYNLYKARGRRPKVGVYVVHQPGQAPQLQAMVQAANILTCHGPVWVDVEIEPGMTPYQASWALWQHVKTLEDVLGHRVGIYTSPGFWNANYDPDAYPWDEHPLWLAHYTDRSVPDIPAPWWGFALHQYTRRGRLDGVPGHLDFSRRGVSWKEYYDLGRLRPLDLPGDGKVHPPGTGPIP